jgi:uncharacterized protein (DUF2141 family)
MREECAMARHNRRPILGLVGRGVGVVALSSLLAVSALGQQHGEIRVKVVGLHSDQGVLRFGLYNKKEAFATDNGTVASGARPIANGQCEFVISDLPYGTYALIVAHDVNNDGKIDRSPFSPELKGISNYTGKILWFPSFDKAKFQLDRPSISIEIRVY